MLASTDSTDSNRHTDIQTNRGTDRRTKNNLYRWKPGNIAHETLFHWEDIQTNRQTNRQKSELNRLTETSRQPFALREGSSAMKTLPMSGVKQPFSYLYNVRCISVSDLALSEWNIAKSKTNPPTSIRSLGAIHVDPPSLPGESYKSWTYFHQSHRQNVIIIFSNLSQLSRYIDKVLVPHTLMSAWWCNIIVLQIVTYFIISLLW